MCCDFHAKNIVMKNYAGYDVPKELREIVLVKI
jgi:hypothetical protein